MCLRTHMSIPLPYTRVQPPIAFACPFESSSAPGTCPSRLSSHKLIAYIVMARMVMACIVMARVGGSRDRAPRSCARRGAVGADAEPMGGATARPEEGVRACTHACAHAEEGPCVCVRFDLAGAYKHSACVRACAPPCLRACVRACVPVCVRVCVCSCVRACVHA